MLLRCTAAAIAALIVVTPALFAQTAVTYLPYIQLGDAGPLAATDQIVVAWQTNESTPNPGNYLVSFGATTSYGSTAAPTGRVVDNYLAADPQFSSLSIPTTYGTHVDYYAVLSGLSYATTYYYKVTGPGMPNGGFTASFNTRKTVQLSAPPNVAPGGLLVYSLIVTNGSTTSLNGTQVRLTPAGGVTFNGTVSTNLTVDGSDIVATLGHMDPGATEEVQISTTAASECCAGTTLTATSTMTSGTAQPVSGNSVTTTVIAQRRIP